MNFKSLYSNGSNKRYSFCLWKWRFKCWGMSAMIWPLTHLEIFFPRSRSIRAKKFCQYWALENCSWRKFKPNWTEITKQLNPSYTSIIKHLHDLGKMYELDQWVSLHLTVLRLTRVNLYSSLKSRLITEPFLRRIITIDEKWIFYNHLQRKR